MRSLVLVALGLVVACGKSSSKKSEDPTARATPRDWSKISLLAENVLLERAAAYSLDDDDSTPEIDASVTVRPEQILLAADDNSGVGRLKSKNLRDALKNEVAPKLSEVIVGTWAIKTRLNPNLANSSPIANAIDWTQGRITFAADGSATLVSGCATFINRTLCLNYDQVILPILGSGYPSCALTSPMRYEVLGAGVLVVNAKNGCSYGGPDAVLIVAELTSTQIVLVNQSVTDTGSSTYPEIAVLTKASN